MLLLVAAPSAAIVVACSEHAPVSPVVQHISNEPLPSSPRYIIELTAAGKVPANLTARIGAAHGRILRVHEGVGMVIVAGLSAQAATALQSAPGVLHVMPDLQIKMIHEPTMRRFVVPRSVVLRSAVGARGNPGNAHFFPLQWNMMVTQADSAWSLSNQGSGTKVFILDTGVDTAHQDLKGLVDIPLCTSFAFAANDTLLLNPLPFSHDVVGHGTFVSSIIASNSIGVAAVAPQAKLVMVRVLDDSGSGTVSSLFNGILYATDSGADIINMSLGGYVSRVSGGFLALADFYQRVVDYAAQHNVVLVAAAGNESVNTNTATAPTGSYADSLNTPAGLRHVLSIGATGPVDTANFDTIAQYSNFGDAGVGVFAPGGNDVDTLEQDLVFGACSSATSFCPDSEDTYLIGAGTSFAAPMAAAEAAVVKAQTAGAVTGSGLEMCVLVSATNVTGKRPDPNYNYGRINVLSALRNSSCKSGG